MTNKTLTFSEKSKGWTSFFSFYPDWMVGMNQFFYTFKNGALYRHNTNERRNNFYGVDYPSQITSVFNEAPVANKLYKTINLESTDSWGAILETDIQTSGFIQPTWYEKKEGSFFAFIRNQGDVPANVSEYPLRSINGISQSVSVGGTTNVPEINFAPTVNIGTIISVGDLMYFVVPPLVGVLSPLLAGQVTSVLVDKQTGVNRIVLDATISGTQPITVQDPYFFYVKNAVSESHGVLGHYCKFTIENNSIEPVELFVVEADVMKSFP
jgi:hypothetical protein